MVNLFDKIFRKKKLPIIGTTEQIVDNNNQILQNTLDSGYIWVDAKTLLSLVSSNKESLLDSYVRSFYVDDFECVINREGPYGSSFRIYAPKNALVKIFDKEFTVKQLYTEEIQDEYFCLIIFEIYKRIRCTLNSYGEFNFPGVIGTNHISEFVQLADGLSPSEFGTKIKPFVEITTNDVEDDRTPVDLTNLLLKAKEYYWNKSNNMEHVISLRNQLQELLRIVKAEQETSNFVKNHVKVDVFINEDTLPNGDHPKSVTINGETYSVNNVGATYWPSVSLLHSTQSIVNSFIDLNISRLRSDKEACYKLDYGRYFPEGIVKFKLPITLLMFLIQNV